MSKSIIAALYKNAKYNATESANKTLESEQSYVHKLIAALFQSAATTLENEMLQLPVFSPEPDLTQTTPPSSPSVTSPGEGTTLTSNQLSVTFDKDPLDLAGFQVYSEAGVLVADSGALTTNNPIVVTVPISGNNMIIRPVYQIAGAGAVIPLPDISVTQFLGTSYTFVETKLTDNANEPGVNQHFYSRRNPFNADETLIYIYRQTDGAAGNSKIVDLQGNSVYTNIPFFRAHIWHNTNPFLLYGCVGNQFGVTDVRVGSFTALYTYNGSGNILIGQWEGTPDNAQRYFPLSSSSEMMVLDRNTNTVTARIPRPSSYNWHSVSDSGNHIVVVDGNSSTSPLYIYDINFNLQHTNNSSAHDDFYIAGGVDYLFKVGTTPRIINLDTNANTFPGSSGTASAFQGHASGVASDDLVLLTVQGTAAHSTMADNSIGTIIPSQGLDSYEQWVLHGSSSNTYNTQPKAGMARSGLKMVYTSDKSGVSEDYLVEKVFS